MDVIQENLQYLMERHKDVYEAYTNYGKIIHEKEGPIEEKNRWLIKISISASLGYSYALKTHIWKASKAGCTRDEIEHAILLVAPSAGFPRMMEALLILRNEFDEDLNRKD
ncbi:MAG: carboxymuconolactone decarboxylase family protein [Clostridiaceae bacterium]|nr:carboxymuconolactone decarboxylase family protein [Clostridiaceae bacterium]